jgi:arabinan endo-1,5-alpha-L-arabinosidase
MGKIIFALTVILLSGQTAFINAQFGPDKPQNVKLYDMHWRDVCIFPDSTTGYYYMIGPGGKAVLSYRSKDLIHWEDPRIIFEIPDNLWGDIEIVNIWAPELHFYKRKYYLFLTFNTNNKFDEQWPNWRPRVTRGSQILVSDSLTGPFEPFQNHSTLPADMMTLDATLWVEDGIPYIVYAHEWVQISNGTMEYMQLKDDLSETVGEPVLMFRGNVAPWVLASKTEGCFVTDGPYLRKNKSGKLMMIWASYGEGGYTEGVAFSETGKLAGPWIQQSDPLYSNDGGHGMLFETFDGKLMMVLHSPNNRNSRPHIFEMEDTGDALKIKREL